MRNKNIKLYEIGKQTDQNVFPSTPLDNYEKKNSPQKELRE